MFHSEVYCDALINRIIVPSLIETQYIHENYWQIFKALMCNAVDI